MNWRVRIQVHTVAYAVAVILGICAIAFAGLAGYLALSERFAPDTAALLTAAGFIVTALVVIAIARLITWYGRRRRLERRQQRSADNLEHLLQNSVDPAIADWIKRNPGSALAVTLLAGVAAGYSDTARGVFKDLYSRYFSDISSDD